MHDKRTKHPLAHRIERGMMRKVMHDLRDSDKVREANLRGESTGHETYERVADTLHVSSNVGLPLTPVQKLLRKHAMRKAVRAKLKSEGAR